MSFVYLAQPYSHPDSKVRAARFKIAEFMTAHYSHNNEFIYSPIVHFHRLSVLYYLPTNAEFWRNNNFAMLGKADTLRVLEMPGHDVSVGLKAEVDFYVDRCPFVPIQYVSWKEITTLIANHKDDEASVPLGYHVDIAGNLK